jgi:hypothetical protein
MVAHLKGAVRLEGIELDDERGGKELSRVWYCRLWRRV